MRREQLVPSLEEESTRWPWSAAVACAVVGVWFAAMVKLAASGFFRTWPGLGPLSSVQVAIATPPLVIAAAGTLVGPLRAWIRGLDLHFLAGVQVLRILGAAHLVSWGAGIMAGSFALPVGLGNTVVAGLALKAVVTLGRDRSAGRRWLWVLTIVGALEFFMTIALAVTGFFPRPTAWDPPVRIEGYMHFVDLPLSVFPTFLIPLFLSIHVVTALRLRV
jgi:hypothetical protein